MLCINDRMPIDTVGHWADSKDAYEGVPLLGHGYVCLNKTLSNILKHQHSTSQVLPRRSAACFWKRYGNPCFATA